MRSFEPKNECPRCGYPITQSWHELTDDQRFIIERLPTADHEPLEERKKHRFCKRCLFEDRLRETREA